MLSRVRIYVCLEERLYQVHLCIKFRYCERRDKTTNEPLDFEGLVTNSEGAFTVGWILLYGVSHLKSGGAAVWLNSGFSL